jgi:hypothetical protein
MKKLKYNGRVYGILETEYKDIHLPIIIDGKFIKQIQKFNKNWRCTPSGLVMCTHKIKNDIVDIFLHEVILAMDEGRQTLAERSTDAILHLNRIGLDNRLANLRYNNATTKTYRNTKKKRRTVKFPKESGIKPKDIPTYIWYMKPNGTHGDRFSVVIDNINWKTTSSKKISLIEKLDDAKEHLRELKIDRPDLFEKYCMNGEYTKEGKGLLKSFYDVIHKAGYTHIKRKTTDNITDKYLK